MILQTKLERLIDQQGLFDILSVLAVICDERAKNLAPHDAHKAKDYAQYADALDSAIVKMWGRL